MGYRWPNELQRDKNYFSEIIHLKKILLLLKLFHAIYFSDNFEMCLILIMDHLLVMSDPMDVNGNTQTV